MDISFYQIALILLVFGGGGAFALHKDRKLSEACPKCKRYRWGYFQGVTFIALAPLFTFVQISILAETEYASSATTGVSILWAAVGIAVGLGMISRKRPAWVIVIGLGALNGLSLDFFSLAFAVVNGFYARSRWSELSASI